MATEIEAILFQPDNDFPLDILNCTQRIINDLNALNDKTLERLEAIKNSEHDNIQIVPKIGTKGIL